ncbi:MAG: PD-(D/E)XK nuclease family protein [Syntrophomonadaceae bacterium]
MNVLLQELAAAVKNYPWQEKLLLIPSRSYGYQLMDGLAREGTPWLNLRPVTPLALALEIVEPDLMRRGLQLASRYQCLAILDQIIAAMEGRGELKYFRTISEAGQLSAMLLRSIHDLRRAGINPADVKPESFVDQPKGVELQPIFNLYDLELEAQHLVDEAEVFGRALYLAPDQAGAPHSRMLLIPEQMEFSPVAFSFLEKFRGASLVLAQDPVVGLDNPVPRSFKPDDPPSPQSGLSYIFSPPADDIASYNISMFQAYGEACEVREVLRRIKKSGLPLDQIMLCVTRNQPYLSIVCAEAMRMKLPVAWASGVPAVSTHPGKLISGLLEWMRSNYPISVIYGLLVGGDLDVFPPLEAAILLRDSGIVWGKHRCLQQLGQMARELEGELEAANQAQAAARAERLSGQLFAVRQTQEAMADIIGWIDAAETGDKLDVARLCDGLAAITDKYASVRGDQDALARQAIIEQLSGLAYSNPVPVRPGAATKMLEQMLAGLLVGASGPRPGHLYVAGVDDGVWCSRPVTYLLGMDAARMEGRTFQDPVLLDCEREQLSPWLDLQRRQQQQRTYRVAALLASRRGPVTISFPGYDVLDARPCAPSSLLLHIHRLQSGKPGADYSDLLNSLPAAAVYVPEDAALAIDESDWWLGQILGPGAGGMAPDDVAACFPGLRQGLHAYCSRCSDAFTAYDGRISAGAELDPRLNPDRALSASAIETMARCPFLYFLRYVLKIAPPEEMKIDNSAWLDPRQRGSLLHSIYCAYQNQVYGPGQPNRPDKQLLLTIADREIEALRRQVPPPDLLVFRLEKEEMLQGLEVYYYMLEEKHQNGDSLPLYSEMPFGMGAAEVQAAGIGQAEPVEIKLPSGLSFRLRGKIDLVEKAVNGKAYQVWDYKNGGTWGYSDRDFCKGGQQVQHLLYSIAAENILGASLGQGPVQIDLAGYLFPTDKGEGRIIARRQDRRDVGLQAVEKLLELMGEGIFCCSSADTYCKKCEYRTVCGGTKATKMLVTKLGNAANDCLKGWKELQDYE